MTQNENGFKDLHLRLDNQDIIKTQSKLLWLHSMRIVFENVFKNTFLKSFFF